MLTRSQSARLVACLCVFFALFLTHARAQESNADYWRQEARRAVPLKSGPVSHAKGSVAALVAAAARRHGVPVRLALGVAKVESGMRCNARNGRALGAMQVFKATARSVGVTGNLLDCATGIEAGVRYLRLALDRAGSLCGAASLFNKGLYARPSCSGYALKVMRKS